MRNNLTFTDTHCHIHEEKYPDAEGAYQRALEAGVGRMICVGTDTRTSAEAVRFASTHTNVWAVVGIHPHEAAREGGEINALQRILEAPCDNPSKNLESRVRNLKETRHTIPNSKFQILNSKIVGIGEIGLDYYYNHSPREMQLRVLEAQLQIAVDHDLPVSFHVREAFDDFWPVLGNFKAVRGVLHSYTDNLSNIEKGLSRGLLIGVNGIATFARDREAVYRAIPVDHLLLETDAPYLTPIPHRGRVNEPAFITFIAQSIANLQSISLQELSRVTERNASHLFSI